MNTRLFQVSIVLVTFVCLLCTPTGAESKHQSTSSSKPRTTQPRPVKYLGIPVSEDWINYYFKECGEHFFRAGDEVVNVLETNNQWRGKPLLIEWQLVGKDDLGKERTLALKGLVVRLPSPIVGEVKDKLYILDLDIGRCLFISQDKYLQGEKLKIPYYYGISDHDNDWFYTVTRRSGPLAYEEKIPVRHKFIEAKAASKDDFISYINTGKRVVASLKPISIEAAKLLNNEDYTFNYLDGHIQYYQFVILKAPPLGSTTKPTTTAPGSMPST